jgi:hypothetical protein
LLKKNRLAVQETTRTNEEESRLGRIFMQLETAMTQSEDPRDAGDLACNCKSFCCVVDFTPFYRGTQNFRREIENFEARREQRGVCWY